MAFGIPRINSSLDYLRIMKSFTVLFEQLRRYIELKRKQIFNICMIYIFQSFYIGRKL